MYLVPGYTKFRPALRYPISYFDWLFKFCTFNLFNKDVISRYLNTLSLVMGSILLSLLIILILIYLKKSFSGIWVKMIINILGFSSGLHILVLGIVFYLLFRKTGVTPGVFFILAIGNGVLIEMYFTSKAEIDKILSKEYVLAGVAWGFSPIKFAFNEIAITIIEQSIARVPILFSSTIIIEYLFNIKGLSYTIFTGIVNKDYDAIILATVLISATIILLNILSEKIRFYIDPRVKYGTE